MGNLKSFGTATTPEEKAWEMEVRRKGQLAQAEKRHRKKALNDILDAILAMKCDTSALTDDYITETAQKLAAEKGESITLYEAIALSQIKRAIDGDTVTDADRRLMENISKRLGIE